jgi:predicted nucleic acid-binding Zn finger protein
MKQVGGDRGIFPPQARPNSSTLDRSALFAAYNVARAAARRGYIDRARLNRALGLAQRTTIPARYVTTLERCSCPDFTYRRHGLPCKHVYALMLRELAA